MMKSQFKIKKTAWNKGLPAFWAKNLSHAFKKGSIPWNKGRQLSEKEKEKISLATKLGMQKLRPEKKAKMIHLGRRQSLEERNKRSRLAKKYGFGKWMLGRTPSLETRKKTGESLKRAYAEGRIVHPRPLLGKFHSEETCKKLSLSKMKDKNPQWRGGKTLLRDQIENLKKYALWISGVFQRDNWTCVQCKKKGGELEADHIKMLSRILEKFKVKTVEQAENCSAIWDLNNGQALCKSCHRQKSAMDYKIYMGKVPELNII